MQSDKDQRFDDEVEHIIEKFQADIEAAQYGAHEKAALFNRMLDVLIRPHHSTLFWGDRMMSLDKSMGFLDQPALHIALDSIRGAHDYDDYRGPHTIAWRLHTLVWAAENGLRLPGDFVECGVFQGDMAWVITQVLDLGALGKSFYLYDTFSGFSDTYSSSADFPDNPGFLEFANEIYSKPGLYKSVCDRFADDKSVKLVRGVVPDILKKDAPDRISFLHIDLNSPTAEIGALELLFERVSPGGIVVFDDYGWKVFRAQKEAEDQFMAERGYAILELPTGQGVVVKR